VNVAFLANSYHLQKTKSTDFLIALLREWFGVVAVIPHKEAWAQLPGTRWDLIVVFQHLYDPRELEAFGAQKVVIVPMYDDCPQEREFWDRYRGFQVLSFSKTLGALLEDWGDDLLTVQYWQPVSQKPVSQDAGLRGFFWPRTRDLGWGHLVPLLEGARWESFHLHVTNPEGSASLPDENQRRAWNVQQTAWFDDPVDYLKAVSEATVFFAPRRYEGIGQAVLEALGLGLCVVAPDLPTMNEYIHHGVNGLLFDPDHPRPLDWSQAALCGTRARESAVAGRQRWEQSLVSLRAFLETPATRPRTGFHPLIILRGRGTALLRFGFRLLKKVLHRG